MVIKYSDLFSDFEARQAFMRAYMLDFFERHPEFKSNQDKLDADTPAEE